MNLWDFYNLWICFGNNDLIIIDKKQLKTYYNFNDAKEVWHREVRSFYIKDNNLYIRIK